MRRDPLAFQTRDLTSCGCREFANVANDVVMAIWLRQKSTLLGKPFLIGAGARGGNQERDFRPVSCSMMRKRKTIHGAGHLDIGEQHMDALVVDLENAQGGFGVFDLHHGKAGILKRLDEDKTNNVFVLGHKDQNLVKHLSFTPGSEPQLLAVPSGSTPVGLVTGMQSATDHSSLIRRQGLGRHQSAIQLPSGFDFRWQLGKADPVTPQDRAGGFQ